ncbi:hypothetical protein H2200_012980 [Cladophialophora chaetospira]|uniref:Uncharacterized protein n=1 Tax=Cladophialophora chaetospira TaxID=386627 RepID=A0AA38WWI6_9EURO|nr:hypothetical protein H2200_012980 [Cladophialophora chaetospira]
MGPRKSKRTKPKGKGKGKEKNESSSDHLESVAADAIEEEQEDTTAGSVDISATETPASDTISRLHSKKRRNKKKSPSANLSGIPEPIRPKEDPLEPVTKAPPPSAETTFDPKENALHDPNSTRIPKEHILAIFPTEASWREVHKTAVMHNNFARRRIVTYVLFHSAIRNVEMPHVLEKGELLEQDQWPYSAIPEDVRQNRVAWLKWMTDLDEAISNAIIQSNWMLLLDREYKATAPVWKRFYDLIHQLDEAKKACEFTFMVMPPQKVLNQLAEMEVTMAMWNRRRHFLQRATIVGRAWEAKLHRPPPPWIDWNIVLTDILRAAGVEPLAGMSLNDEVEGEYESGHVSELEDTESEEEFDL